MSNDIRERERQNQVCLNKYINRLREIRNRYDLINEFLEKNKTTGFVGTDADLLCVQFRKIIEEIVFLSLVAFEDEYQTKFTDGIRDWNIKRILKRLEDINNKFYPEPFIENRKIENGKEIISHLKSDKDFLTKNDAIEIYGKCGSWLHAHNPYKQLTFKHVDDLNRLFMPWLLKIQNLLHPHQIILSDKKIMIMGSLNYKDKGAWAYIGQETPHSA